jgi:hypothetical protein
VRSHCYTAISHCSYIVLSSLSALSLSHCYLTLRSHSALLSYSHSATYHWIATNLDRACLLAASTLRAALVAPLPNAALLAVLPAALVAVLLSHPFLPLLQLRIHRALGVSKGTTTQALGCANDRRHHQWAEYVDSWMCEALGWVPTALWSAAYHPAVLSDAADVSPLLPAPALLSLVLVECRLRLRIAHWPCVLLVHDWLLQHLSLIGLASTCCCAVCLERSCGS